VPLPTGTGEGNPRETWSDIEGVTRVLNDLTGVLISLRQAAQSLQRRAYMDGHAAGFARAQADTVRQALDAQLKAREFVDASGQHIVSMALASVERMASRLGPATVVTALLTEALDAIKTERELRVSVSRSAAKATREMLARWQSEHPQTVVQVLVDPQLEPFGCEVTSELGRIELGLRKQLEATRNESSGAAPASIAIVTVPSTAADQTDENGPEWWP
jgi:flagellar biosynthesis/type III secretory pathway protein FliH